MRDAAAYADQLKSLLPRGAAWSVPPGSALDAFLLGFAEEFARLDRRGTDLMREADPRTTLEMLADWERVAGLPDSCYAAPDNLPERRVALAQKVTGLGGQSRAYFIDLAARLGWDIEIEEHRPARIGMRLGGRLNSLDWAHTWTVHILPFDGDPSEDPFRIARAKIGDRMGVRLRGWGAIDLECVIRRAAPAHSIVLFAYDSIPVALLWANFTEGEN